MKFLFHGPISPGDKPCQVRVFSLNSLFLEVNLKCWKMMQHRGLFVVSVGRGVGLQLSCPHLPWEAWAAEGPPPSCAAPSGQPVLCAHWCLCLPHGMWPGRAQCSPFLPCLSDTELRWGPVPLCQVPGPCADLCPTRRRSSSSLTSSAHGAAL